MRWMMLICALPLIVLLFTGDTRFSAGYLWPLLIGVFVLAHVWMMFKGHGEHGGKSDAHTEGINHRHGGDVCH